jgi:hypothetical protein
MAIYTENLKPSNGIVITDPGPSNSILSNSIFSNTALGIDLGSVHHQPDGITPNDAGDPDTGPNNFQNFPVLTCATSANGQTNIQGTLNSLANTSFRIEFFANDACDSSGNGEGQTFLGFQNVTTVGNDAPINVTLPVAVAAGKFITATATRLDAMGNPIETSEFSACRAVLAPTLTINDVGVVEGNAGNINAVFTVTLTGAQGNCLPVTMNFATTDNTATTANNDYTANAGMLTFNTPIASNSVTQTITVLVKGDTSVEANETFFVNLSGATNATIVDNQGLGTITNDDSATIAVNDVNVVEGNAGMTTATFNVTLSNPSTEQVTVNFATASGTATAGSDFNASSGTITFVPGVTMQTVMVQVIGDTTAEANETFFVNLSGVAGTSAAVPDPTLGDTQGQSTILDDDFLRVLAGDPLVCLGPGGVVNVTATVTNPNAAPTTFNFTATLPAQLLALPGTCTTNVASTACTAANAASGTLNAGQTVTLNYQAQVADGTPTGTQLCINSTAIIGSVAAAVTACVTINCPAVGPGSIFPAASEVSDQKAGSVLAFNLYSSSIAAPNAQNTRIALTNTHPALPVAVHLFFVDGATCSIADSLVCLTANQTASFLASDIDPGTTGYIIAVASDAVTGCPINFNYLIGDAYVKLSSGHAANLAAEGFAALAGGLPTCDANSVTTVLNFDGVSYNRVPRTLAASNIPSRADGNDTLLVLNRLGGSLVTGAATLTNLFGLLYDDAENPLSFNFSPGVCQFRSSLSNNFPRIAPRFDQFIPAGRSGWAKFYATGELGLLGAQLNYNPNAGTAANAFNQGHNLHKLTLTQSVQLTIPIFPPNC